MQRPMITVLGEALIDLVPTADDGLVQAQPGGRPLLVAVGAARLGFPTTLMARISRDPFGQFLRRHAAGHGVNLSAAPEADEPTTVAIAVAEADRAAPGSLYYHGTADWQWTAAELAWLPATSTVLCLGSLACCVPPGSARILRRAARQRARGTLICLDLAAHPEVMESPGRGRILAERLIASADVVRATAADLGWLYPGRSLEDVARQWLGGQGPRLVVITCGADGAMAVRGAGSVVHRPAYSPRVADTVAVGAAFTAALLGGLFQLRQAGRAIEAASGREIANLLDRASAVAGVASERPAGDVPTAVELRLALRARSPPEKEALTS
jgi:fructokinase